MDHPPDIAPLRELANQMFSRASGAPLREHNRVAILKDAADNYPAWLHAIHAARRSVHIEMYIVHDDEQGQLFADAFLAAARRGVHVRLLYDWMGAIGKGSHRFWNRLRAGGVDVRCFNPARFDRPLAWLNRDHRKLIVVDGTVAFVTGLCIGQAWVGDIARKLEPWRDTGVEVLGPAVRDIEDAFAEAWAATGHPLHGRRAAAPDSAQPAGDVALRVIATLPSTAGLFRLDQLVAAMAKHRLWLTDAYYAGTTPYVAALRAAAQDGVDVRLLVPGASDVPVVRTFSRAGYRPLLEAGIRVFEWNGSMLHAKTAVADGRWARVGSTNLNLASWMGNREIDVMIENERIAAQMEAMFVADLDHATEVVLNLRNRVRAPGAPRRRRRPVKGRGSGGRMVAGAIRISNTVTAAMANRRVLEPIEAHIALASGFALAGVGTFAVFFPRVFAYPVAAVAAWMAGALLWRAFILYQRRRRKRT